MPRAANVFFRLVRALAQYFLLPFRQTRQGHLAEMCVGEAKPDILMNIAYAPGCFQIDFRGDAPLEQARTPKSWALLHHRHPFAAPRQVLRRRGRPRPSPDGNHIKFRGIHLPIPPLFCQVLASYHCYPKRCVGK